MRAGEFVRKVKDLARQNKVYFRYDATSGKGSHGRILFGDRQTTVKSLQKELGEGLLNAMCKQLGIEKSDLF